jgi:ATP-dependent RNA helicase DOB1
VWEESIILLPSSARFVFLSATIPNAREFSEWIASLHHQICHVVYTEHRPVPLRCYISPLGDPKLYLVRNADGDIVDTAFAVVCQAPGAGRPSKKALRAHTCRMILQLVHDGLSPMIVFVFSRRDCDSLHEQFAGHSFVAPEEKSLIKLVFRNAVAKLDPGDRCLPQVEATLRLAQRGIGVHHGGLLPLMKEVTEVLFGQGLLKVLFATETFAMGLNMPAKTVVFHDLFKFDGSDRRLITSGEFIQMSGRAGRRNEDRFGIVALTYAGDVSPPDLRAMMTEAAQPLNSEFHVTYNMLLNLVLTGHIQPQELMRRSFHQFQMLRQLSLLARRKQANLDAAAAIVIENEELAQAAVDLDDEISRIERRMREIALDERNVGQILVPGRVVRDCDFGWGVVAARRGSGIDLLARSGLQFAKMKRELGDIAAIGRASLAVSFESLSSDRMWKVLQTIRSLEQKGIATLEPAEYVTFRRDEFAGGQLELDRLRPRTTAVDAASVAKYKLKRGHLMEVEAMEHRIAEMQHLVDQKDLDAMVAVLNKLEFFEGGVISMKGRMAATITAGSELVVTQLMLSGVLEELSPQDCAALFSAFVAKEKVAKHAPVMPGTFKAAKQVAAILDAVSAAGMLGAKKVTKQAVAMPGAIKAAWAQLLTIARNVATTAADCGCDIDVEKFQRSFCPVFVSLTKDWAGGASFAKLMESNTELYEGLFVRTMKRLDELLNQAAKAAEVAGIGQLKQKFIDAAKAIERGIVFTASLYL